MAITDAITSITLPAAADLSTHQFKLVKVDANGRAALCTASTDLAIGTLMNKPSAIDQPAEVAVIGATKVVIGAAVTAGTIGMVNASSQAITATSTNRAIGIFLTNGTAAGQVVAFGLFTGKHII